MARNIIYRRQLLLAVEAFLEETPASHVQAQRIVQRCSTAIRSEAKKFTLTQIIWGFFVKALTDSVYYESEEFLREVHEILLGHSSQNIARTIFIDNYRTHFTSDETEWYEQLLRILDFITAIPFAKIHEATFHAWQNQTTWAKMRKIIPEAIQVEEIEEEYRRRKELIKTIAARNPSPGNIGDETIYHLVLQEVTNLLTGLSVGRAAVYCGYPLIDSPYTGYGNAVDLVPGISLHALDMSETIVWSKRILEALEGKGGLFLSCRLGKASTFDSDVLFVSIH